MSDDLGIVQEFIERYRSRQFSGDELRAFYAQMEERRSAVMGNVAFWQSVYTELLGIGAVTVPPVPDRITDKQWKSFRKYNFMLLYIPALTEDRYPSTFVKLEWTRYVKAGVIERVPFTGQWVALEMIQLPEPEAPPPGGDPFMEALGIKSRLGLPPDGLSIVPIGRMSKVGFPKEKTRIPTVEELNFIANLFLWLGRNREMCVPEICRRNTYEWCGNRTEGGGALGYGTSAYNGLAHTHLFDPDYGFPHVGFRILVEV